MKSIITHRVIQWLYFWGLALLISITPYGAQAQETKLVLPIGHTQPISAVAYSPNGKYVATGSNDKTVKVWDLNTGQLLLDLTGYSEPVEQVSYSPTGTKLLTSSKEGTTKLWDVATGTLRLNLTQSIVKGGAQRASFSPDGKYILTVAGSTVAAEGDKRILTVAQNTGLYTVWDASSGKALWNLDGNIKLADNMETSRAVADVVQFGTPTAAYSPNGKVILTYFLGVKLWDAATGKLIKELKLKEPNIYGWGKAAFSPDGKHVAIVYTDQGVRIWDIASQTVSLTLSKDKDRFISSLAYSPDGQQLLISQRGGPSQESVTAWSATTGKPLSQLPQTIWAGYAAKRLLSISADYTSLQVGVGGSAPSQPFGTGQGLPKKGLGDCLATISSNGQYLRAVAGTTLKTWETTTGTLLQTLSLEGRGRRNRISVFSHDGQRVATMVDPGVRIWDVNSGRTLLIIPTIVSDNIRYTSGSTIAFSPDDRSLVTSVTPDDMARVWDTTTGKLLLTLNGTKDRKGFTESARFSSDGKRILTVCNRTVKIWDAATGRLLLDLKENTSEIVDAAFSPDGSKLGTIARGYSNNTTANPNPYSVIEASIELWDAQKGKRLLTIKDPDSGFDSAEHLVFSPDGKYLLAASPAHAIVAKKVAGQARPHYAPYANIWDATTGQLVAALMDEAALFKANPNLALATDAPATTLAVTAVALPPLVQTSGLAYSSDGKRVATVSSDNTTKVWDAATGVLLLDRQANSGGYLSSVAFSPDSRRLLVTHSDKVEIIDLERKELLYQYVPLQETDFLTVDRFNRYDGTPAARDLLYFTCGLEVVSLNQVKEQLWVPGLTSRLTKGEAINAKTIADLHLCGLVPEVKSLKGSQGYNYQITPHQGGLGETVLSVNGIEVKRSQPSQLKKTATGYELAVSRAEVQSYFVAGKPNTVSVKAYTKTDRIASRGADVIDHSTATSKARPNLFAVMVGVSDYKGDELDLNYAAKDAQDLSGALGSSARKLFNTDGQQHVFLYNLTTNPTHDRLPEKSSIRQTFEEIGRKATANDIILVFLAGHGVVNEQNKKFYFLTADASNSTATTSAVTEVGISTQELAEWMQPSRLKAQKRILILDACNSGQAIKDLPASGIGITARADDQAQQVKAIDRLNEQAGVFILAASASNQRAYEMSGYAQGLLTYALLEAMKNHADILEDQRYLNVGRWFDAAKQTVSDVAQQLGRQQQSQVYATTNFVVGTVDAEVLAGIVLPKQKVLFSTSNVQNQDGDVGTDDLGLSLLLDAELHSLVARGTAPDLAFADNTASPDAYRLTGRYEVKGEQVKVRVDVRRGREILTRLEEKSSKNDLKNVATTIAARATDWIEKHK